MKGIDQRHYIRFSGNDACEFQGHADGAGATGCEEHSFQISRAQCGESLSERDGSCVGVATRGEGEEVELFFEAREDKFISIAELMNVVAMKVEILFAEVVDEVDAFGAVDHVQARRGERLVQEELFVLLQEMACRLGEFRLPAFTFG